MIVGALSIGLSIPGLWLYRKPLAYKIASLKHTDERQPPLLVCYYKSYLPSRSSFHI